MCVFQVNTILFKPSFFILWRHLKLQASLLSAYCQSSSISIVTILFLRAPYSGTPAAHCCIELYILGTRSAPRVWFIWGSANDLNSNNPSEMCDSLAFSRLISNVLETAQWLSLQMIKRFSCNVREGSSFDREIDFWPIILHLKHLVINFSTRLTV